MAYLVSVDDRVLHAATHGVMDREDLGYLRNRMESALRASGGVASGYLKRVKDKLDTVDLSLLRERVETVMDRYSSRWDEDRIRPLVKLVSFRNAKPVMRRLLMAEPRYRALWQKGFAEGFGDLYVDDDVGAVGSDHTTYREIMNGAYLDDVTDEDRWVIHLGVADEITGESKYGKLEKDYVRMSWEQLRAYLDEGRYDPLSPSCNTL